MPNPHVLYRNTVIENVQNRHGVVSLVAENLSAYMNRIRDMQKGTHSYFSAQNLFFSSAFFKDHDESHIHYRTHFRI